MQNSTSYEPTASRSPVTQKLGDDNYFKWSFEMEMYLTREELWDNCKYTEEEFEEFVLGPKSPYKLKQSKFIESKNEFKNEYKMTPMKKKMKSLSDATDSEEEEPIMFRETIDEKAAYKALKKFRERDGKCRATLGCCVTEKYYDILKRHTNAKEVWEALKAETGVANSHYLINLKYQFYTCKMNERESLTKFLDRVAMLNAKMREFGAPIDEKEVCYMIICHLPEKYKPLQQSLITRTDLTIGLLRNQFLLVSETGEKNERIKPTNIAEGNAAVGEKRREKDTRPCFKCGTPGHFAKDCRAPKWKVDKYAATKPKKDESKKNGSVNQTDAISLMLAAEIREEKKEAQTNQIMPVRRNTWYFDSGCTKHMTGCLANLEERQPTNYKVSGPLRETQEANTQGAVNLKCKKNDSQIMKVKLNDVLFVPNLNKNLISISQLCKKGVTCQFKKEKLLVFGPNGSQIMQATIDENGLYELEQEEVVVNAVNTEEKVATANATTALPMKTWHERLGHLSTSSLMKSTKLAEDIKIKEGEEEMKCETCSAGKQVRKKFSKDADKMPMPSEIGERIHTDICGPITPATWSGNHYFVSFVDEATRKSWIYFISSRDQMIEKYKEFNEMLMTQKNVKIKTLRCDGAGEYVGDQFKAYLRERGTIQEITPPYTAQWNGIAERLNRTLMDKARCMLKAKNLDCRFWGEATATANYLRNISPTKRLDVTPEEKYSNKKPTYSHLRIFGAKVRYRDNLPSLRKLEDRSKEGMLVGYTYDGKLYRIWSNGNHLAISRDVVFFEDQKYELEEKKNEERNPNFPEFEIGDRIAAEFDKGKKMKQYQGTIHDVNHEAQSYHVIFDDGEEILDMKEDEMKKISLAYQSAAEQIAVPEPQTWEEMMKSPDKDKWIEAVNKEINSITSMETWSEVPKPKDKPIIKSKWIFKIKYNSNGTIDRYKARLVAKGFTQTKGIDYEETFAPVVRHETMRYLFAYATERRLPIIAMDVETAFLNGELEEEVYMEIPEGFAKPGAICRLNKALYGLKQSPRAWNQKMTSYLKEENFVQSAADPCLFIKKIEARIAILSLYVDDCMLIGEMKDIQQIKDILTSQFKMKDLGEVKQIVGIQVERSQESTKIFQTKKIEEMLTKFAMQDCRGVDTPLPQDHQATKPLSEPFEDPTKYREAVGALNYLAVCTRPDISYAVSQISKKMQSPTKEDWMMIKRIFRYLQKTKDAKLVYHSKPEELVGYSDASYAPNTEERKSISGYLFQMNGAAISWKSKKQPIVSLSSMEAEYIALTAAIKEAKWLVKLEEELMLKTKKMVIFEDNQSTIKTAKNEIHTERSKHIDVRYHFVREQIQIGAIEVRYCPTGEMTADLMTKALGATKHAKFSKDLGLVI
jgi:hypothetical protein